MPRKYSPFESSAGERPVARPLGGQDHNNPATIEQFAREHLGVAAKE